MNNELAEKITKKLRGTGVNSTNRLSTLLALTAFEEPEVFWQVFHENWSDCDNAWGLRDDVLNALEWFGLDGVCMTDEQQAFLSGVATDRYSRITVYRGCSSARVHGLSWTTNPKVAQEFALGHRGIRVPDPVVLKAEIRKSNVITAIPDREEDEIILDPLHLRCLRETNLQPAKYMRTMRPQWRHPAVK
ncbi:hypothetical protein ABIF94_002490 [Bradyrhizobium ottawaense]|uniref:hypothetical protein n=1 Tax=Bradyrhizobium ottawaense TaxID=931866 RepID=UPI003833F06E